MVQCSRHVLFIVDLAVGAAVGMLPQLAALIDGQAAAAVEGLVRVHDAGVQARRRRDELEHRAGHVQLGDVLILPLRLAHHTLQLGVLAGDLVAVLVGSLLAADAAIRDNVGDGLFAQASFEPVDVVGIDLLFIQNVGHFGVGDLVWVVGVELLDSRHSQNCTSLDVHHNGAAAAMHREGVHRLAQVFFDDRLYVFVDRQVQVVAIDGLMDVRLPGRQHVAVDVGLGHAAPRRTGQRLVVIFFQTVSALAVAVAEAQHRREELAVGVAAGRGLLGRKVQNFAAGLCAVLRFHAVGIGVVEDGVHHRFFEFFRQHTVLVCLAVRVFGGQYTVDIVRRRAVVQQGGDALCPGADLRIRRTAVEDGGRVGNNVPYRIALGKQLAVRAVD